MIYVYIEPKIALNTPRKKQRKLLTFHGESM